MNWTRRCRSAASRRGPRVDARWAEHEELKLTKLPIPGFERLKSVRRFLDGCVRAIEEAARLRYRKVLGVRALCSQEPQERPERLARRPAPWCHTTVPALRSEYMEKVRSSAISFAEASESWRLGNLTAKFPAFVVRPFLWPIQAVPAVAS
jgi:hypothetical protein